MKTKNDFQVNRGFMGLQTKNLVNQEIPNGLKILQHEELMQIKGGDDPPLIGSTVRDHDFD